LEQDRRESYQPPPWVTTLTSPDTNINKPDQRPQLWPSRWLYVGDCPR
jgi:hypothetical protein